ncbi:hypothetical protein DM01DRAFT_1331885 [Hesseltinella vesiculosa]|uniref:Uncharacterized protein n=1 Tax=Hesseltinella vesiculosa TaxID=101127 RepID=A0A1X2GWW2_9FUNG|nr:hypothetical protein DM01DRAFT_1331885 [Hesseltinella vesiculosa]
MYGEVAFCLAGLKPVVLIDLPPALEKQYVATVLDPWIQAFNGAHRQQQQQWQRLQRRLLTPEMHGMMVTFLLGPHTPTAVSNQLQHTSIDSEQALASLLDYPGHLPANAQQLQTMLEVAYFNKANHQLLTTFACQQPETPLVQRHFDQYATVMKSFGLDIGLVIRSPI